MASWTWANSSTGRSGTIQSWTVPTTSMYRIDAYGASGANGFYNTNLTSDVTYRARGVGARAYGDFYLTAGTVLKILIGQMGTEETVYNHRPGGGGGGTFIIAVNPNGQYTMADNTFKFDPLVIVGGGGGGGNGNYGQTAGQGGVATELGGIPSGAISTNVMGDGGLSGSHSGGGSGLISNGYVKDLTLSSAAQSFINGGLGGLPNSWATLAVGGFGGGGPAGLLAGSGGGYSGGNGYGTWSSTGSSGGGGTFVAPSGQNKYTQAAARDGHGYLTISDISGAMPLTNLKMYSVTFNYKTIPGGTVYFDYGTTTSFGTTVSATGVAANATGSILTPGLARDTLYYYRFRDSGYTGPSLSFRTLTGLAQFTVQPTTNITTSSMTVNATLTNVDE